MVLWITGLSGAGKTTIANAIHNLLKSSFLQPIFIDGDAVREIFDPQLGFDIASRNIQISRMQRLALFLSKQGFQVIVSALYSSDELLAWNRSNLPGYYEVYVDTQMHVLEKRDTKGLYSKAKLGQIRDVVGVDIPWNPPKNPDLNVDSSGASPSELALKIVNLIPWLKNTS